MSENSLSSEGAANRSARIFAQSLDDEICITGIAGKFPNSKNVAEFEYNLYNKVKCLIHCNLYNLTQLPFRLIWLMNPQIVGQTTIQKCRSAWATSAKLIVSMLNSLASTISRHKLLIHKDVSCKNVLTRQSLTPELTRKLYVAQGLVCSLGRALQSQRKHGSMTNCRNGDLESLGRASRPIAVHQS